MQSHEILIGVLLVIDLILIDAHFIRILVYFILVLIVKSKVVEEIDKELAGVDLVPLRNA
jgi:hypothetical protein